MTLLIRNRVKYPHIFAWYQDAPYALAAIRAHFSLPCIHLQNFFMFNAPILHPKKNLLWIKPLTGILSIPYFLRRMDGIVSTPFRKQVCLLNSSVFLALWDKTLFFDLTDTLLRQTRLHSLGWHCFFIGQLIQISLWKDTTHCPVLVL